MYQGKTVSVVLPTYRERGSIKNAIEEFLSTGAVDEVIVVDNNAEPGTAEEVAKTPARLVREPRQGYGWALRRGIEEARGDLVVLSEPDGTFHGRDLGKLLAYSEDFDVVFGTRTSRDHIMRGANMGWALKMGNVLWARLVQFLFNTTHLTDVGCTMRLLRREALDRIRPCFTVGGSAFGLEMMLLAIRSGARYTEIPVKYRKRVGKSAVTGSPAKTVLLAARMLLLILEMRFLRPWRGERAPRRDLD